MPTLHSHPLASFCWKVLIALYETGVAFDAVLVDFGDPTSAEAFKKLSPMRKMPVLVDGNAIVGESSVVIEYVDRYAPADKRMIPDDRDEALRVRYWDRFFDHYVHHPMQAIVADALRPANARDPYGVDMARTQLRQAYDVLHAHLAGRAFAAGNAFSLADCAAAPALFYARAVEPFGAARGEVAAYLGRLMRRPSFARVIEEAKPYFKYYPLDPKPDVTPPE